jgi:hypothetical protein
MPPLRGKRTSLRSGSTEDSPFKSKGTLGGTKPLIGGLIVDEQLLGTSHIAPGICRGILSLTSTVITGVAGRRSPWMLGQVPKHSTPRIDDISDTAIFSLLRSTQAELQWYDDHLGAVRFRLIVSV